MKEIVIGRDEISVGDEIFTGEPSYRIRVVEVNRETGNVNVEISNLLDHSNVIAPLAKGAAFRVVASE